MHKHIILFFSALFFLFACKENKTVKGIINKDEMVRLLADVHIVDGSLSLRINSDTLYKYGTDRYAYLFKQYHTDSAQFKKSLRYYTTQPDDLLKMYDDVNKLLQAKSDSLNKIIAADAARERKKAEKRAQDSLKKIKERSLKDTIKHTNALPKK